MITKYCIKSEEPRFKMTICHTHLLKVVRDDACFPSAERPFQALAPLKEKHLKLVFELFLGSLKSVSVFRKHLEVSWDVLVDRRHVY